MILKQVINTEYHKPFRLPLVATKIRLCEKVKVRKKAGVEMELKLGQTCDYNCFQSNHRTQVTEPFCHLPSNSCFK